MSYKFNYADLKNAETIKAVKTITDENGNSSAGKYLVLQSVHDDGEIDRFEIISGDSVGVDIFNKVARDYHRILPAHDVPPSKRLKYHYELVYIPEISDSKIFYRVFVGDYGRITSSMTRFCFTADEVITTLGDMSKKDREATDIYVIKYEYGKDSSYTGIKASESC